MVVRTVGAAAGPPGIDVAPVSFNVPALTRNTPPCRASVLPVRAGLLRKGPARVNVPVPTLSNDKPPAPSTVPDNVELVFNPPTCQRAAEPASPPRRMPVLVPRSSPIGTVL